MSLFLLAQGSATTASAKEALSIYYSSTLSAQERQESIKSALSGASLDVTVFAKFKDFSEDLKSRKVNVVVAPAFFGRFYTDYSPVLEFTDVGTRKFKYILLSLSDKWNAGNIGSGKLGVVEEIDRDNLKDVVTGLLNTKFAMIKSVTKPEDLFPLLVFKAADFILISPQNHTKLKEKFTTKVYKVAESASVEMPMVFVKKGTNASDAVSALKSIPENALKNLGFSGLEAVGGSQ